MKTDTQSRQATHSQSHQTAPKRHSPPICQIVDVWLNDGKAQGLSARTLEERGGMLRRFIWWVENEAAVQPDLEALSPDLIRRFLAYCREPHPTGRFASTNVLASRKAKPQTIFGYFRELRAFDRFCQNEGFVDASFLRNVKAPKVPHEQVQPFTDEQVQRLLDACKQTVAPRRNAAMLLIMLDSGLRVSELISLNVGQVQATTGELTITGKGGKVRTVYLGVAARRALRIYLNRDRRQAEADDPVFISEGGVRKGERLTTSGIRIMMRDLNEAAKLEGVRVSPHTLRHTFAISFLRGGGNLFELQRLMGHTDLTVLRRYVALAEADLAKAHRMASPADRMKLR